MYQIVAQLGAFNSVKQYGQLAARVGGAFIDQFAAISTCIIDGIAANDFASVGGCTGKIVMILFDSSLWNSLHSTHLVIILRL